MRRFCFTVMAILNLAVILLSGYSYRCLQDIRENAHKLAYSLHGPLDESVQLPEPKTMEELRAHYERVITARWNIMHETLRDYAAFHETATIQMGISVLLVAASFLSYFVAGRSRQEPVKVNNDGCPRHRSAQPPAAI